MTPCIACEFANLEQARSILCARDAYIKAMHPHEWALKMQSRHPVTEDAYLTFLALNVLEWNADERERLQSAIQALNERLAEQQIPLVESIVFIKTTGNEEWNSAYTRSNAIILPERKLRNYPDQLALLRLLAHEVVHIVSRRHPQLRTALYQSIGYRRIESGSLEFPKTLKAQMLTNPDSPYSDHYITLSYHGEPVHVVPIIVLKNQLATVDSTQDILRSLQTQLLVIEHREGQWQAAWVNEDPLCLDPHQVTGWQDILGFIPDMEFDPEEILAEQFAGLMTEEHELPMTEIRAAMKTIIMSKITHNG
jgi:hypothetical protein